MADNEDEQIKISRGVFNRICDLVISFAHEINAIRAKPSPEDGRCNCALPRHEDCERIGFPSGCYHKPLPADVTGLVDRASTLQTALDSLEEGVNVCHEDPMDLVHEAVPLIITQAREIEQLKTQCQKYDEVIGSETIQALDDKKRAEAAEARARTSGASNQWSIQVIGDLRAERDAIEARTIERCAKVADKYAKEGDYPTWSPAAAIRGLARERADAKG